MSFGDNGIGAGCSGNVVLNPLPLVIKMIGRRGNRNATTKPKEKYITGASNGMIHHIPLSRLRVDSTLSMPRDIFSLEIVYANLR